MRQTAKTVELDIGRRIERFSLHLAAREIQAVRDLNDAQQRGLPSAEAKRRGEISAHRRDHFDLISEFGDLLNRVRKADRDRSG